MLKRKLSLKNVAFAQSPFTFKVERGDNLPVQNDVFDIRCVLRDGVDDSVAKSFFLVVPVETGAQLVGGVLHEAGKYVLARRRDGRIGERGDDHVNVGLPREVAVLGIVVGALHVFDGRRNRDCTAQVRAGAGIALKFGSASSAMFTLPDEPRYLKRLMSSRKSAGSWSASMNLLKVGADPHWMKLCRHRFRLRSPKRRLWLCRLSQ